MVEANRVMLIIINVCEVYKRVIIDCLVKTILTYKAHQCSFNMFNYIFVYVVVRGTCSILFFRWCDFSINLYLRCK